MPLTHADLKRLSDGGLNHRDYIAWVSVDELDSAYPDVRLQDGYYYMGLKRVGNGLCILADNRGGKVRCAVHGIHPIVCRVYPVNPFDMTLLKKRSGRTPAS